jgi:hypothetical protein
MSEEYLPVVKDQTQKCLTRFRTMLSQINTTPQTKACFTAECWNFIAWAENTRLLKYAGVEDQKLVAKHVVAIHTCLKDLDKFLCGRVTLSQAEHAAEKTLAGINDGICTLNKLNEDFAEIKRQKDEAVLRDGVYRVCRAIEALEVDVMKLDLRVDLSGHALVKSVGSGVRRLITVAETLGWWEGESEDEGYGSSRMEG